jgi:hypothetical protein
MKSFKQFMSESINISGDFNGTLVINGSDLDNQPTKESFGADIMWEGKIYRLEVEGSMMDKNALAEQLQGEYPGAIVHTVYPIEEDKGSIKVKSSQRYQPERLTWTKE